MTPAISPILSVLGVRVDQQRPHVPALRVGAEEDTRPRAAGAAAPRRPGRCAASTKNGPMSAEQQDARARIDEAERSAVPLIRPCS